MAVTLGATLLVAVCCFYGTAADIMDPPTNITNPRERKITIAGDSFVLDGAQFRYVAGSLHYFRLPEQYWRHRLRQLRIAGLNAVSTYVEWSFHEPEERQYEWAGDHDLVHFLQIAAEENLLVLLRPGPYICAERDLGGLPYWLLSKYPNIKLRTNDKDYMYEVVKWMEVLFQKIQPLLYGNGGPVILVQVENEYGSYPACDGAYMQTLRDTIHGHVKDAALLYTTDGTLPSMIRCGSVNRTLTTIDFGTGTNPETAFRTLREFMPHGPLVNSEYYPGWLTHWSEKMQRVSSDAVVNNLRRMLSMGASVNFYVFFGGTNFEFTAGANFGPTYQPDITSYDYDAPLTEYGSPTAKYIAIKKVLEEYHPWARDLQIDDEVRTAGYGTVRLTPRLALLSASGRSTLGRVSEKVTGASLPTFEKLRQRGGLLLFETKVAAGGHKLLHIPKPRDRVYVFIDGRYAGVVSRMHGILSLPLNLRDGSTLSLLVENQGRINFGSSLKDFKGILSAVMLNEICLSGEWTVLRYPLEQLVIPEDATYETAEGTLMTGPVLFQGTFTVPGDKAPQDTFLDPTGWTKGYVWVNGHNVGRYWPTVGPQVTLYVPGVYLNTAPAQNVLQVLELESSGSSTPYFQVQLVDKPIFFNSKTYNITRV